MFLYSWILNKNRIKKSQDREDRNLHIQRQDLIIVHEKLRSFSLSLLLSLYCSCRIKSILDDLLIREIFFNTQFYL